MSEHEKGDQTYFEWDAAQGGVEEYIHLAYCSNLKAMWLSENWGNYPGGPKKHDVILIAYKKVEEGTKGHPTEAMPFSRAVRAIRESDFKRIFGDMLYKKEEKTTARCIGIWVKNGEKPADFRYFKEPLVFSNT